MTATMLPRDSEELFDLLDGDPILNDILGTHVLRDGRRRLALARLFPNENLEVDTQVYGVDLAVDRLPMGYASTPFVTGETDLRPTLRVTITQWEPEPGSGQGYEIEHVLQRLQQLLPLARTNNVTIDGLTTGVAQHVLTWTSPVAVVGRDH